MAIPMRTGTAIDPTAITAAIDPTATIGHTLIMADLTATTVVPTAITVVQVSASPLASRPRADQNTPGRRPGCPNASAVRSRRGLSERCHCPAAITSSNKASTAAWPLVSLTRMSMAAR